MGELYVKKLHEDEPWSEMDLFDLRNCLGYGSSLREIADFLMRREDEVRAKALELWLITERSHPKPKTNAGLLRG